MQALCCVLLAALLCCSAPVFARKPHLSSSGHGSSSFTDRLEAMRKLAAAERQDLSRRLVEQLDTLDDLDLTQLRVPREALSSDGSLGGGVYGSYGVGAGVYGAYGAAFAANGDTQLAAEEALA